MTTNPPRTKRAVVACMRNEAVFVPEWVAYHLSIGFDRIFLVTNNCQDGTDLIAERLSELEPVIHIRSEVPEGGSPQTLGLPLAHNHPAMADVEWLLHIDADEFLNVSTGNRTVNDLIDIAGDADCIALAWRYMASGGRTEWTGGSLLAEQTQTHDQVSEQVASFKSMFRPDRFGRITSHLPKEPVNRVPSLRNAEGILVNPKDLQMRGKPNYVHLDPQHVTWVNADIHHYFVRSQDVFLLKNIRGDGMGYHHSNHMLGSQLWTQAERTTTTDTNIQAHLPAVQARLARYTTDTALHQLMENAQIWLDKQRLTYLTPENRKLWDIRDELARKSERKLAKNAARAQSGQKPGSNPPVAPESQ